MWKFKAHKKSLEEKAVDVLLSILREGLLHTRARGLDGQPEQCANEADHLHNLPGLIRNLRLDELLYYFNISRPAFINLGGNPVGFEPLWAELESILKEMQSKQAR